MFCISARRYFRYVCSEMVFGKNLHHSETGHNGYIRNTSFHIVQDFPERCFQTESHYFRKDCTLKLAYVVAQY